MVIGIFFFGFAGILNLLNVTVESYTSLFIFVSVYFVIGFILDLFSGGIVAVVAQKLSGKELLLTRLVIEGSFDYFALFAADELITSISIPPLIKLIIVLILFVLSTTFEEKGRRVK